MERWETAHSAGRGERQKSTAGKAQPKDREMEMGQKFQQDAQSELMLMGDDDRASTGNNNKLKALLNSFSYRAKPQAQEINQVPEPTTEKSLAVTGAQLHLLVLSYGVSCLQIHTPSSRSALPYTIE
ncbi:hypothetical protein CLAIMM_13554 [Cladophialophora immunda]|nr:hypothetical protein CLAIMM_13554 [Cladophialophora immunda]